MSDTGRRQRREPRERPFAYVPRGIQVNIRELDNMRYVRDLLAKKPDIAADVNNMLKSI